MSIFLVAALGALLVAVAIPFVFWIVKAVNGGMLPLTGPGGEPWDIAMACVYLGSDESRWVTGIDMVIDAGMLAVKGDHQGTTKQTIRMWEEHDARLGRS